MIAYEIIGDDGPPWVITPGGRFSKDVPGIRELAAGLAARGQRVLIWDRPNCGASDVCFTGASESEMQADTLAGLLRALDMAPGDHRRRLGRRRASRCSPRSAIPTSRRSSRCGGSRAGSTDCSLLAVHYCGESVRAAWQGGMEAVVELPEWAEVLERNPRNRDRFLALDPQQFIATLERWMLVYCPTPASTVPGLTDAELARLDVPTLDLPQRRERPAPHACDVGAPARADLRLAARRAAVARRRVDTSAASPRATAAGPVRTLAPARAPAAGVRRALTQSAQSRSMFK